MVDFTRPRRHQALPLGPAFLRMSGDLPMWRGSRVKLVEAYVAFRNVTYF